MKNKMITLEEFRQQNTLNSNLAKLSTEELTELIKQTQLALQKSRELDKKWGWSKK